MSIYTQLRLWHVYYEIVIGVFSYFLTFTVIYLCIYKANKTMKQYSLIIILSSIVELVYSTMTIMSMPVADMIEGKLFLMNTGYFEHVRPPYSIIIFSLWLFTMYVIMVNTCMIFVYRYKILCHKETFTMRRFILLYIFLVFYVSIQSGLCYWTAEDSSKSFLDVIRVNELFAEDTPTTNVYDATKLIPFLHLMHGNFISSCLYAIIIYTGLRVHRCLVFSRQFMSRSTISVNNQLTRIMILQAACPLIMIVFPVLLYCSGPIFHVTLPFAGIIFGCSISLIPIINGVTTICIIPSFRRALIQKLLGTRFNAKISSQNGGSITIQGIAYNVRPDRMPMTQTNEFV